MEKIELVYRLKIDGKSNYKRRVYSSIIKAKKKVLRPLDISTIEDRAKQMLAKFALEPEWEAIFEPNSYGLRPGRSCHDAIDSLFLSIDPLFLPVDFPTIRRRADRMASSSWWIGGSGNSC